jgi:hypothetical protein
MEDECVGELLHSAHIVHKCVTRPAGSQIPPPLSGPLTVTEAARQMNRAQSVLGEMLFALERKQWVMRFPDAQRHERARRRFHLAANLPAQPSRYDAEGYAAPRS